MLGSLFNSCRADRRDCLLIPFWTAFLVKAFVEAVLSISLEMLLLLEHVGEWLVKLGLRVLHFEVNLGMSNYGLNLINLLLVVANIMQLCYRFRLIGHVLCKFIFIVLTIFLLWADEALSLLLKLSDAASRRVPWIQIGLAVRVLEYHLASVLA